MVNLIENQAGGQNGSDSEIDAIFADYYKATGRDALGRRLEDAGSAEIVSKTRSGINWKTASILLPVIAATAFASASVPQTAHANPDDNGTTVEFVSKAGGNRMVDHSVGGRLTSNLAGGGIAELVAFAEGGYLWQDKNNGKDKGRFNDHPYLAGGGGLKLFLDPKDNVSWDILAGANYAFARKDNPAETKGFAETGLNVRFPLGKKDGPSITLGVGGQYDFAGTNLPEKWHHRLWTIVKAGFRF